MSEELLYIALSDGPFGAQRSLRLVIQLSGGGVAELFYQDMTSEDVIAALRRMADGLETRTEAQKGA